MNFISKELRNERMNSRYREMLCCLPERPLLRFWSAVNIPPSSIAQQLSRASYLKLFERGSMGLCTLFQEVTCEWAPKFMKRPLGTQGGTTAFFRRDWPVLSAPPRAGPGPRFAPGKSAPWVQIWHRQPDTKPAAAGPATPPSSPPCRFQR